MAKKRKALFISTTQDEQTQGRIEADFFAYLQRVHGIDFYSDEVFGTDIFFEHGQWWARVELDNDENPTRTFSVVDIETDGETSVDFEEL